MSDLTEFLLARVAEDEAVADAADALGKIAALVAAGQRTAQLAIDYGISPSQVQRIARGVRGKPTFLGRREVALTDLPIPHIT